MKKVWKKKLASLLAGVTLTYGGGMVFAYPVDLDYLGTSNPVTISANFGFYNGGVYAGYELLSLMVCAQSIVFAFIELFRPLEQLNMISDLLPMGSL